MTPRNNKPMEPVYREWLHTYYQLHPHADTTEAKAAFRNKYNHAYVAEIWLTDMSDSEFMKVKQGVKQHG